MITHGCNKKENKNSIHFKSLFEEQIILTISHHFVMLIPWK